MTKNPFVRRNAVVYHCPTPDPAQALLFGNGRMGGSVHTPDDSLYILVSRSDLWNETAAMGALAAVRIRGGSRLFEGAKSIRQECRLDEASIQIEAGTEDGPVTFTVTCLRTQDILLIDIRDGRNSPAPFEAVIENWHEGDILSPGSETIHVNQSSCFEEINRKVNVDAAEIGVKDPLLKRAWGLFLNTPDSRAGASHRFVVSTVCHSPDCDQASPEDSVRKDGRALLRQAEDHAETWLQEHRQWWAEFWNRSHLSLESRTGDAEYEERLWHVNHYYHACACGGAYPPRFNGAFFLLDRDRRAWDWGYWFQNMREIYWPMPTAGHWEWMPEFFDMYFKALPFIRKQTQSLFGMEAIACRETQTFWGAVSDANPAAGEINDASHHNFSNMLELCLLMHWYVEASGDQTFFRDKFYPFLREVAHFYIEYARKGPDGLYHLAPSNALEVWPNMKDPMPDMAGLHFLLPRLVAWGEEMEEPPETLATWREFRENIAPIPIGRWTFTREYQWGIHNAEYLVKAEAAPDGILLPAADKVSEEPALRCNQENAELYAVWPWGLISRDSSEEERRRFENTWNNRIWRYLNVGWAQDTPELARMGWHEKAKTSSLEHADYTQRFPNGSFICAAHPDLHGLLTSTPYLDSSGVHLTGLQEMLLQSHDGVLRIAPAISAEWSGVFKLHGLGGSIVHARFYQGQPITARVEVTCDGQLQIRNTSRNAMLIGDSRMAIDEIFTASVKAGEVVEVCWECCAEIASLGLGDRPEVIYPGYKIRPPQACWPTGHWHDERKGHGQVGLAADGLFPATRPPR